MFDAIAAASVRLVGAFSAVVLRVHDGMVHLAALTSTSARGDKVLRSQYPRPLRRLPALARAVRNGAPFVVGDLQAGPTVPADVRAAARARGIRGHAVVPMMRKGEAVGLIAVSRREAGDFSAQEVGLLKTFADQAVIAIENARRFNETKEALERQTATAEILKVISSSVADAQPVFAAINESCERLFRGAQVGISVVGTDGQLHLGAYRGPGRKKFASYFPMPLSRATGAGSAILGKRIVEFVDMTAKGVPEYVRKSSRATGTQSIIFAPMLKQGRGIGAIYVARRFKGTFSDKERALLRTFADQAVIAIEN
ncbi:MAG TPA: GAF domain-containing protein, partial [Burkholderiales bacterium]|nr:GAF domain-containing protein [Burkholderiales bacterium]